MFNERTKDCGGDRYRFRRRAFGGVWIGVFASVLIASCRKPSEKPRPSPKIPPESPAAEPARPVTDANRQVERLEWPQPVSHDYVGSAVCAGCHADIAERYQSHPMANSMAVSSKAPAIEDYSQAPFSPIRTMYYYAEKTDEEIVHHEKRVTPDGTVIYDQGVPIAYTIGTGAVGRSYLLREGGHLYESPITWYSQPHKWDLSPGYGPLINARFDRRISDGCLSCHAGRVAHRQGFPRQYEKPLLIEGGIGCERCHGPGKQHVELQSGTLANIEDPIVNPIDFIDGRRDAVCGQCHLQGSRRITRYGRDEFDFRPGEYLSENWVVFLKTQEIESGHASIVSQMEQMHVSKCYTGTQGALSCVSCHDPHSRPDEEHMATFYRERCLNCHGAGHVECSEPVAARTRISPEDSCIECHMPGFSAANIAHTTQTDHRVPRRPSPDEAESDLTGPPEIDLLETILFLEDGYELSPTSAERARGIYLADRADVNLDQQAAREAAALLAPILKVALRDVEARYAYGQALKVMKRTQGAIHVWQQALAMQPNNEQVMEALATLYHEEGNLPAASGMYERLIALAPQRANLYGRHAHVLGQMGELDRGIEAAEMAIKLNPSLVQAHAWLAEVYLRTGDLDKSKKHQLKVSQFRAASQAAQGNSSNSRGRGR